VLAELLLRALTPASPPLRRMGLLEDSIGLWSRSTRRRREWRPHYERCCAVVKGVIEDLPQRRTVVVLGSGLVQDVPLDLLCTAFQRVLLVDAVHLPMVKWRMRSRAGVKLLTRDLTGLAGLISGTETERTPPLVDLAADAKIDLVVSANLLSQLPLGVETLMDGDRTAAARLPHDAAARTIAWHLDDLAGFSCRVCLLTDVTMRGEDKTGRVVETLDLMRARNMPSAEDAWDWLVAPFGEIDRGIRYVHRVHAYSDWRVLDAVAVDPAIETGA
jgi:hypothetical protein